MSTPTERLTRLINEGAEIKTELLDLYAVDVTSEVVALDEVQTPSREFEPMKESLSLNDLRPGVPTGVQIP